MLPNTVYHGTGLERLESIRKHGILPTTKKTMSPYVKDTAFSDIVCGRVHTTDEFKVACFFGVAGYESNAVVLEINTNNIDRMEYIEAPVFKKYKEYRLLNPIPPECIEKVHRVIPIPQSWTAITYPQTRKYHACPYIREERCNR